MVVRAVPEGYTAVTPYLIISGAGDAIEFYTKVFGATEVMRFAQPDGKVGHAEIQIGDAKVMLADESPEQGYRSPKSIGGSGSGVMLYLADVDGVFARAVAAGCTVHQPVTDQFYGDRSGAVVDPFGHMWTIATHIEDVSEEEMQRRMQATSGA